MKLTAQILNNLHRIGRHGAVLAVGIGIGLLIAHLLPGRETRAPGPVPSSPGESPTQLRRVQLPATEAAWGKLETIEFPLEVPDASLPLLSPAAHPPKWRFPGQSVMGVMELLRSCGLSEQVTAEFIEGAEWQAAVPSAFSAYVDGFPLESVTVEGVSLSPSPQSLLSLSAATRRCLYSVLAASELNPAHRYPFRFRPEVFRSALARAELPRDKAAAVRQLAYKDEGSVCLADVSALNSVLTSNEYSRLLKSLHQVPTLVLRVRVPSPDDVEALVRYWGRGGREQIIEPYLEGLARVPGAKSISVSFFLPAFARTRLYTFPPPGAVPAEPRQDCLWTALNFFNDPPDNRLLESDYAERALRTGFERSPGPPSYGDLVLLSNPAGEWVHMGVYLADDVMFTKSGVGHRQPWVLMRISDAMFQFHSLGAVQPLFYTRKST